MNILISGCGVAGITAALYLQRHQHRITIVERDLSEAQKGYGISVKGFGVKILQELGLYAALKQAEVPIDDFGLYGASGKLIRRFSRKLIDEMTGETVAVSRAGLHEILFEALPFGVKVINNNRIQSVTQSNESVLVTFNSGEQHAFDLLVVAEGLRSSTRKMIWNTDHIKSFDITYAAAILQTKHSFRTAEARTYKGVGRSISIFPVSEDKLAIQASFRGTKQGTGYSKTVLADEFSGFAKEITELLDAMDTNVPVFYDAVAMVGVNEYSNGRVVLLGDAAYCPSFFSGMGASLSMLGAKLLSDEINTNTGVLERALHNYNALMLPLAKHFQNNAIVNMKRELPENKLSERLFKPLMTCIPESLMKKEVHKQLLATAPLINQILNRNV